MTTTELIAYLEKLPKDTVIGVIYSMHSEYSVLNEADLRFHDVTKEGVDVKGCYRSNNRFIVRNGSIMEYDPKTWDIKEGLPQFVSVLIFPGN